MEEKIWTTAQGQQILISELADDHLLNIARMLINVAIRKEFYQSLALVRIASSSLFGEMAQESVIDSLIQGEDDPHYAIPQHFPFLVQDVRYQPINEELKRRGYESRFSDGRLEGWVFEPAEEWYS